MCTNVSLEVSHGYNSKLPFALLVNGVRGAFYFNLPFKDAPTLPQTAFASSHDEQSNGVEEESNGVEEESSGVV